LEIVAVYWEPRIKTYGVMNRPGLNLLRLDFAASDLSALAVALAEADENGPGFHLVTALLLSPGRMRLNLLIDGTLEGRIRNRLSAVSLGGAPVGIGSDAPVDLIHFHGPHFGDRYGIADAAFSSLAASGLRPLLAACSASSIYLALPGGLGQEACRILEDCFEVPQRRLHQTGS